MITLSPFFTNYFTLDITWIIISAMVSFLAYCYTRNRSQRRRYYATGLTFYVMLVLFYTVIGRVPTGEMSFQIIPLMSYFTDTYGSTEHIFLNYLLFVPIGIMMPRLKSYHQSLRFSFILTVVIEVLQLVTTRGCFQVDDIIGNFFGAVIGCIIVHEWRKYKYGSSYKYYHHHHHGHVHGYSHSHSHNHAYAHAHHRSPSHNTVHVNAN